MADNFEIHQAEVTLKVHFSEPPLDLFADFPAFLKGVLSHLGPLGVRLADSRFESATDNLGEIHLRCFLSGGSQGVRFYLDRIEIWAAKGGWDALFKLLPAAIAGVRAHREIELQVYDATVVIHGTPRERTASEVLSQLNVRAPNNFGPLIASGATFYFGADVGSFASILTFDLSAHVPEAIFVRVHQVYDAHSLGAESVVPRLRHDYLKSLASLGLETEAE